LGGTNFFLDSPKDEVIKKGGRRENQQLAVKKEVSFLQKKICITRIPPRHIGRYRLYPHK
jgi:hypothetical protein